MWYVPTNVEILISNILVDHGITKLWDLNIYDLSKAFKIKIKYCDVGSMLLVSKGKVGIIINSQKNEREQYISFLHELGHYILEHLSFQYLEEYQWKYFELKANKMIEYLSMPYFLIDTIVNLNSVKKVANHFYVTEQLARKRLENIRDRIYSMRGDTNASVQGQEREMVLSN